MKNSEVAEQFMQGDTKAKTKHFFIEGNVLYSYGYHFPIALRLADGFIVNSNRNSMTTNRHRGYFMRSAFHTNSEEELWDNEFVLFVTTEQLQHYIDDFNDFQNKFKKLPDLKGFKAWLVAREI